MPICSIGGFNIKDGTYIYTRDLLALEDVSVATQPLVQHHSSIVTGFLPWEEWSPFLDQHPDSRFAAFMRRGITHGFRIGFDQRSTLKKPQPNFQSVARNPIVVDKYIESELATGRLAVISSTALVVRKNPIGIIPKPHQPGKFRLIVDLSSPVGGSVNDGIDKNLCSLQFTSVD